MSPNGHSSPNIISGCLAKTCPKAWSARPARMAERIDLFRRSLAGAARAIARDPEVEVIFASDNASATGKIARVASPGPALEPRLVAEARGAADAVALKLRHHDARLH